MAFRIVFVWALTWGLRWSVSRRRGATEATKTEQEADMRSESTGLDRDREDPVFQAPELVDSENWIPGILELWYSGCFEESPSARMFPTPRWDPCLVVEWTDHTVHACAKEAAKRNMTHIGMKKSYGTIICQCGITPLLTNDHPQIPDINCGEPNAEGEREGDNWKNAVYALKLPTHLRIRVEIWGTWTYSVELWYLGCFTKGPDFSEKCVLDEITGDWATNVRTHECAEAAKARNYTHIGFTGSKESSKGKCRCGTLDMMTSKDPLPLRSPDSECGEPMDDISQDEGVRGMRLTHKKRTAYYEFKLLDAA